MGPFSDLIPDLDFLMGWRRGFFTEDGGLMSSSPLRLLPVAGNFATRLRFRVDFGAYSSLNAEGASESSDSSSNSSFFILVFAILGVVEAD